MNLALATALLLGAFVPDPFAPEPLAPLPAELVGCWADEDMLNPDEKEKGRMIHLDVTGPAALFAGDPVTLSKVAPKFDAKTGRLSLRYVSVDPKTHEMDLRTLGIVVAQFTYDPKRKVLIPIEEKGKPIPAAADGKSPQPLRHRTKEFSEQNKKVFFGG